MISKIIKKMMGVKPKWKDLERFDPVWKERIAIMASYVKRDDGKVLDIGCGPMWLKSYLPIGVEYIGLDYKNRGHDCLVCDLNRDEFPTTDAKVYFVSGCLEYVSDVDRFIGTITKNANKCILSYCSIDKFPSSRERLRRGWINNFSTNEIIEKFRCGGMNIVGLEMTDKDNTLMVFVKSEDK